MYLKVLTPEVSQHLQKQTGTDTAREIGMEASTVNEEAARSLNDSKRIKSRRSGAYLNFWENGGNNAGEAGRDRSWRRATTVLTDGPRTGSQVAGGELHQ